MSDEAVREGCTFAAFANRSSLKALSLTVPGSVPALLIHAAGEEAAVDDEDLAGDERGRVGGEKDGRADELLGFAEAVHGRAHLEFLAARGIVEQVGVESSAEDAGSDGIDHHAFLRPLDGQRAG